MKVKHTLTALTLASSLLLTGCTRNPSNDRDPYESFNRAMFHFNQKVDKAIMRPVSRLYTMVFPGPVRQGIGNVLNNLSEVAALPNDLLQGKMSFFLHDFMRIVVNTTLGIAGLFDVATRIGIKHHDQGLAITLAYYSPKDSKSAYLVLPFLGPHTVRSAVGRLGDYYSEPIAYMEDGWQNAAVGTSIIDKRTSLMDANAVIDHAFDPYVLVRNAFFQSHDHKMKNAMYEKVPGDELPEEEITDPDVAAIHEVEKKSQ